MKKAYTILHTFKRSKISVILFLFIFISFSSFSQKLKKKSVKNEQLLYKEIFYVLKEDQSIKQGPYERVRRGVTLEKGQYENNEKSSTWIFYGRNGEVVQKYNYTTGEIVYDPFVEKQKQNADSLKRLPVFIGGYENIYRDFPYMMRYPADARRKGVQGTVYVKFTITTDGKMINEHVVNGIGGGCDEEALRVIKEIPDTWLPALDNTDQPVDGEVVLPVKFQLG